MSRETEVIHQTFQRTFSSQAILAKIFPEGIPDGAELTIDVPSGGDYSGMTIDPEDITVRWETTEERTPTHVMEETDEN